MDVKVMRTTAQIWTFLHQEYESKLELASTLVSILENFQVSKAEATVLNHGLTLDKVAKKLPSQEVRSRWIPKRLSITKD